MPPAVFHGSVSYPPASGEVPGPVVTIGNFDGVHLGHQALLGRTVEGARALGVPSCVLTFHPAPRDVLYPDNDIPRIQSLADKIACLGAVGIDQVVVEPFDRALAGREARWFADEILARRLHAAALVLGWDFRFGRKRAGTVDDLKAWLSVPVEQVRARAEGGEVVSSSRIRALVRAGRVEEAAHLLTRPHRVHGTVGPGDQRGRKIGFPTANLRMETPLRPPGGVYAVRVTVEGEGGSSVCDEGADTGRPAVANLGTRPTFGAGGEPVLEVHLLDFSGDLYGRRLAVDFVARIRDEQRFSGVQALVAQIGRDVARARELLG